MPDGDPSKSNDTRNQQRLSDMETLQRAYSQQLADQSSQLASTRQLVEDLTARVNYSNEQSFRAWEGVKAVFKRIRTLEQANHESAVRVDERVKLSGNKQSRSLLYLALGGTVAGFAQAAINLAQVL